MKGFSGLCGAAALAVSFSGCVPIEEVGGAPGDAGRAITQRRFDALDPGSKVNTGLHFEVHAYGSDMAREITDLAERQYSRIMADTGLYSFIPRGLYPIFVYAGREEYAAKTRLPDWSSGVSVGNSIYTYEDRHVAGVLAHEMTHLIFYEHMGRSDPALRWLNEGLAVYEEDIAMREAGFVRTRGAARVYPFREMIHLAPLEEKERSISDWYHQVGSVVGFMIDKGGRIGFSEFMKALHGGRSLDEAVKIGFPAQWRGLDALEADWRGGR